MKTNEIVDELRDLHQLDVDAVEAYEEAIESMESDVNRRNLEKFRSEHLQHVQDLEECIVKLGGNRPERGQDVKGYLIEGMTKLRSALGEKQALKAMKQNEEITNKRYEKALSRLRDLSASREVMDLVSKNREDERKHLDFIKEVIDHPHTGSSKRSA